MVIGRAGLILAAIVSVTAAQETGAVEGRVRNALDHTGVEGATVTVGAQYAVTDPSGAFRIAGLATGAHTASVEAAGFFKRANLAFRLDSLLAPARLEIELVAESSIAGRVLDEQNNPAPGVHVEITQAVRGTGNTWNVWGSTTDAEGRYDSGALAPGAYLVMARPKRLPEIATYHPSAQTRAQATPIVLRGGTHQTGCDIRLLAPPQHTIRGTVYDETGKPADATITVLSPDPLEKAQLQSHTREGIFQLSLPSGDWRLVADTGRLRGNAEVIVGGRDVENVVLRLAPPFAVRASVEPSLPGKLPVAWLIPADAPPVGSAFGDESSGGILVFPAVYAGHYHVEIFGGIDGYYLDSVWLGERDILGQDAMFTEGMPPLRIVYKADGAAVRGTVENCGTAAILLLPEEEGLWNERFLRRTACDRDGHFQVGGLRPGAWYALALDRIDSTGLDDLATLRRLAAMGEKVRLESGRGAAVELKVMPWPE